jgi:hypothetical protein
VNHVEKFGQLATTDQAAFREDIAPGNDELNSGKKPRREFSHNEIAIAAYHIWLDEGGEHGREQEHWDRAIEGLQNSAFVPAQSSP